MTRFGIISAFRNIRIATMEGAATIDGGASMFSIGAMRVTAWPSGGRHKTVQDEPAGESTSGGWLRPGHVVAADISGGSGREPTGR